jgi:predicted nucleic acid-binding protein
VGAAFRQSEVGDPLRPITFDTGALIAIERGVSAVRALARVLAEDGTPVYIPAPVIAEAWRGGAGRQAPLARFLQDGLARGHVEVVDLTYRVAREVGMILRRAPMSVTDAAVCRCALQAHGGVVTSDPTDIRRIIPIHRIMVV